MRRLTRCEAGSLVELLRLAVTRRDPAALVDAAGEQWGRGPLAAAAGAAAAALRVGEPLSAALARRLPETAVAALRAGELRGDPAGGLARAAEAAARRGLVQRFVVVPAAHPLAVVASSGLAAALLGGLAASPIQDLRVELAHLAGRPAPGGLLALAAAHPGLAVACGLVLALAPLLLPLGLLAASRSRLGSRGLLALPVLGAIARWRAVAELSSSLSDLLAAGLPHSKAWSSAVASVGPRALRERLELLAPAARAGEPLGVMMSAAGLPPAATHALSPRRVEEDGGPEALRELSRAADELHERLVRRAGRAFAAAAGLTGAALALGLFAAVLLPLLSVGGA